MSKVAPPRSRCLQFEALESRELMAVSATLGTGGVLAVSSNDAADQIYFRQTNNLISISGLARSWTAAQVTSITVDLRGGTDLVSLRSIGNGGNQALAERVVISSGAGNKTLQQANSTNLYFSGAGNTIDVASTGIVKVNGIAQNLTNRVAAALSGGVLTVTGTNAADSLQFIRKNDVLSIKGVVGTWAAASVQSIAVYLQDGTDTVSLVSLANGGNQALGIAVTVHSGMGNERVRLQTGGEVNMNGLRNTLQVTSAGTTATLNGAPVTPVVPTPPQPPNWFDTYVADAALRSLGRTLYADSALSRTDIMALFTSAGDNGGVDKTELADLTNIVNTSTLFAGAYDVERLSEYVVLGSTANANYQGQTLGNLVAGSTSTQLTNLVNKWFLGLDRPTSTGTYRQFTGQLFVGGAAYTDVSQGATGDCYFLASLAEVALRNPATLTNMFIVNGDGSYTVSFYNGAAAEFVTVDSFLPTDAGGAAIYAGLGTLYTDTAAELWTMLAEKAYAQANAFGWTRTGLAGSGQNDYSAINGGYIFAALGHLTGQSTAASTSTIAAAGFQTFVTAWNSGKSIGFASKTATPGGSGVVASHAYAVIGYNSTNQTITLYNPWGPSYPTLTLTWTQIQTSFSYFDRLA